MGSLIIASTFSRPTTSNLLLDVVGVSAAVAYSTRRLRAAYSGPCLRVRRSSDDVQQDIGFSGDVLDTTALTTFIGANSGFVVTWYDQSGNANNATQAATDQQPNIVNAGTVRTLNGRTSLFWPNTNVVRLIHSNVNTSGQNMSMVSVVMRVDTGSFRSVVSGVAGSFQTRIENNTNNTASIIRRVSANLLSGVLPVYLDDPTSFIAVSNSSGQLIHLNGFEESNTTASAFTAPNSGIGGGGTPSFEAFSGHIGEVVLFTSSLSLSQRQAAGANCRSHWRGLLTGAEPDGTQLFGVNGSGVSLNGTDWFSQNLTSFTTANQLAPDGTTTASTMIENVGGNRKIRFINPGGLTSNARYRFSIYVKRGAGARQVHLAMVGNTGHSAAFVDLSSGTLGDVYTSGAGSTFAAAVVENAANGFYKVSIDYRVDGTSHFLIIGMSDRTTNTGGFVSQSPSYEGDGTTSLILWRPKLVTIST